MEGKIYEVAPGRNNKNKQLKIIWLLMTSSTVVWTRRHGWSQEKQKHKHRMPKSGWLQNLLNQILIDLVQWNSSTFSTTTMEPLSNYVDPAIWINTLPPCSIKQNSSTFSDNKNLMQENYYDQEWEESQRWKKQKNRSKIYQINLI